MAFGIKQSDIVAIKERTDNLPNDPADESLLEAAIVAAHVATDALISTVDTVAAGIKAQTDKLAGETPVDNPVTANWQSDTATSGLAGADLVTLGTVAVWKKLHSLLVDIAALTATATITIRLYKDINGNNRLVYRETFTQGTDPDGCWVVNGTLEIYGQLRVEVQSDNVGDNPGNVAYEYDLEDM